MDKPLEEYRAKIVECLHNTYREQGEIKSGIEAVDFYVMTRPTELTSIMYEPSLCVIFQGKKEVDFGDQSFFYDATGYLLSCAHIPAQIRVLEASPQKPYMSITIKFTLKEIYDVLKHTHPRKAAPNTLIEKGLFFETMDMKLYEPLVRLIRLLDKPQEEMTFLSDLIIKEMLYTLVTHEKSGPFLSKFAMEGTLSNKITHSIIEIKNGFNEKLNIKQLANKIDMSESSFYQYFKTITSMSPIQFQKKLRLEEAKNMLLHQNIEASEVAFAVGYESASQFSREYSRMFGMPPKAHIEYLQTLAR